QRPKPILVRRVFPLVKTDLHSPSEYGEGRGADLTISRIHERDRYAFRPTPPLSDSQMAGKVGALRSALANFRTKQAVACSHQSRSCWFAGELGPCGIVCEDRKLRSRRLGDCLQN